MAVLRTIQNGALVFLSDDGRQILRIGEELCEGSMILTVQGDIPMELAHEFEDELTTAALACPDLKIDLGGAGFLCAPALKALLNARQLLAKRGGTIRILHTSGAAREKLREAGIEFLFEIGPGRSE